VAERLKSEGHELLGFFYNPNIYPREEFEKRLEVARAVAGELQFPIEVPHQDAEEWYSVAGHLADEPEDGTRCRICYRLRLARTASFMKEGRGDAMTTTLTMSPRKRALVVNQVGAEIAGDKFLARDFKKKDGFKRANELANAWNLYRQSYCGCQYSMRPGPDASVRNA